MGSTERAAAIARIVAALMLVDSASRIQERAKTRQLLADVLEILAPIAERAEKQSDAEKDGDGDQVPNEDLQLFGQLRGYADGSPGVMDRIEDLLK